MDILETRAGATVQLIRKHSSPKRTDSTITLWTLTNGKHAGFVIVVYNNPAFDDPATTSRDPIIVAISLGCKTEANEVRLSRTRAKKAHTAGAYSGFCSMKQLRVLLLPPEWDASPSQDYPQQYVDGTHFIHLGVERQCEVKFLV